jgi:hypothetical protein
MCKAWCRRGCGHFEPVLPAEFICQEWPQDSPNRLPGTWTDRRESHRSTHENQVAPLCRYDEAGTCIDKITDWALAEFRKHYQPGRGRKALDNHLIELAVAGNAAAIVTRKMRDLAHSDLRFPALRVLTPEQCLELYPCPP